MSGAPEMTAAPRKRKEAINWIGWSETAIRTRKITVGVRHRVKQ